MTIETRLRNTGQQGGGGGGSSDSGGLAGTGGLYVVTSASPLLPNSRILVSGSSTTVRTDGTSIYVDATTGASASSAGLMGTANFLVVWSSDPLLSNEKILTAGSSTIIRTDSTAIYVDAVTSATASSGGLAGTGSFYLVWSSDPLLSNEKVLISGSTTTVRTDSTSMYVDASTAGLAFQATAINTTFPLAGGGDLSADRTLTVTTAFFANSARFFVTWSSDPLLSNEKILTSGSSATVRTDSTAIYIDANTANVPVNSAGLMGTANFLITWSSDPLISNEKVLTAGEAITLTTSDTAITVAAQSKDENWYKSYSTGTPTPRAQSFYAGGGCNNATSFASLILSINTLIAVHFVVTRSMRVDTMAILSTATVAGALIRLGIYTNSADNVLQPFQSVSTSGGLVVTPNILTQYQVNETLSANNLYWFIIDVGTGAVTLRSIPLAAVYPILGLESSLAVSSHKVSMNTGKLFETIPPATWTGGFNYTVLGSVPLIVVRPSI